jgi:hypothetical protein
MKAMVKYIVDEIESGAFDFKDIIYIEYKTNSSGEFKGFEAALVIRGPSLFVNENRVEAYWGNDSYKNEYVDKSGLYDYFKKLYYTRAGSKQ